VKKAPACCQILPPHILNKMAEDPAHRDAALRTLATTHRLLGQRDVLEKFAPTPEGSMGMEYRQLFDCGGTENLPGRLVWREGMKTPTDVQESEASLWADATFQLYQQAFGRLSIDGKGMRLISSLSYSRDYDNAFWNGRQMVYGTGDGQLFGRFTKCIDVVGHELTHGVTQFTARLEYQDQPGALNESISDCFGSMVKQFYLGQTTDQADWLIGAGLFLPTVQGRALRDMLNPGTAYDDPRMGKDPQPAHMKDYIDSEDDNGGVHLNSGIPNRAFALACNGIGGKAWEGGGKVWYEALTTMQNPAAQFADWAHQTLDAATKIFGPGSAQFQAVQSAWQQVGVLT
jgi:Zn-dependent metalloprotease